MHQELKGVFSLISVVVGLVLVAVFHSWLLALSLMVILGLILRLRMMTVVLREIDKEIDQIQAVLDGGVHELSLDELRALRNGRARKSSAHILTIPSSRLSH